MKLYIEITNSKLIIAKLKEKTEKYYLTNKEEIKLKSLEFFDNKIFNTSKLYIYLKKYLTKNKIKIIKAIISLSLTNTDKFDQPLTILQISLLVNKLNLKIEKIIGENILKKDKTMPYKFFFTKKEFKNQLDFFKKLQNQEKTSIKSWIFLTLFLIISYTLFFCQTQNKRKDELKKIVLKNKELTNSFTQLNSQIKKVNFLKTENENLQKKIIKLEKHKNSINNPLDLLLSVSKRIPTNCKLTNINTNIKKKENNKKQLYAILEGKAIYQEEISDFLGKLKENPKLSQTKVINIKKINSESGENEYLFTMSCRIKQT